LPSKRTPKKKVEPEEVEVSEVEEQKPKDYSLGRLTKKHLGDCRFGVKDRAGEWLACSVTKSYAVEVFTEESTAFQLVEGCDPWAAIDDSIVVTLTVLEEKPG
jgi:hypothetical protein